MEIYVFFLLLSLCAGQYFDENKVKACSADSTFLQPEKQCHEFCAVSKKLGRGTITFKRNVTSTRNSDKIDTRAESSSVDAQDSESMPFCTIVISSSCVAVLLLTCFCCIIFFLIMRKSRSNEHTDNDQCPLLLNSREDRASQSQERRSDTRRSSPTMTNDSNLSGRKKYDETPMGNDESSDVKDTDKCKTLNHPHTTVNQTTDQCANLEEVPNSRILNDIREPKERMVCKVCLNGKMCVVFLPCNHMVACENCSVMLDRCAVCRTVIKGTLTIASSTSEGRRQKSNGISHGKRQDLLEKSPKQRNGRPNGSRNLEDCEEVQGQQNLQKELEELKDKLMCKICFSCETNVVFLPCGHMISCHVCAPHITKCALCRQPIEDRKKIFLS